MPFADLVRLAAAALIALGMLLSPASDVRLAALPNPQMLGGNDRYLTAVSTDKPVYRTGERVYVRGTLLHAFSRKPLKEGAQASVEIRGPKGDVVAAGTAAVQDSVWSFGWDVPPNQPGGEYAVKVSYPWNGHAPAERKFDVRAYRAPRLKTQIVFQRDGYGPGDQVTATVEVTRAEGGVPSGAKVTVTADVDGAEVARVPGTVDGSGLCTASFQLPKRIERGEGAVAFAIEDGGVVETATKTIPILLQSVDLALYPEGGDLVTGILSRIYFEARTPAKKPADIAGEVLDERTEQVVARFRSEHEGRGRFELTPARGARYVLRITEPAGIERTFPLPDARREGLVLRASADVVAAGAPVRLSVKGTSSDAATVTLSQREVEVASAKVEGKDASVSLDPKDADGVLVATVWDAKGNPLAERLVFRRPRHELEVELVADRTRHVPGEKVSLTARTTRNGKPVSAVVAVTVTDDAVLQMIERREQAPLLPVMALLEPEVKELADAHVYLDAKNPKAPLATDLLLGTQGWRRFALKDWNAFLAANGDAARRAMALRVPVEPPRLIPVMRGMGGMGVRMAPGRPAMAKGAVPFDDAPVPMAAMPMPPAAAMAPVAEPEAVVAQGMAMPEEREAANADLADFASADGRRAKKALRVARPIASGFVNVREYAHAVRPDRQPTDRLDFTETLYWNAGVRTDARTGKATVSFALNDSVTSFKAFAGAFDDGGALGSGEAAVESVQPFYVEAKLPLEVTTGDVVQLPVSMVNGTERALRGARLDIAAKGDLDIGNVTPEDLGPSARVRHLVQVKVSGPSGEVDMTFDARAGKFADKLTRKMKVKSDGFPYEIALAGVLGPIQPAVHQLKIPDGIRPGSVVTKIDVYPTPLANLTSALERMIQDPSGCFEQTSSTSYPLTMAQQYFKSHAGVDPRLVRAAGEKLDAGYKRLVGFECSDKGYEWFGENPGHEALTAYGLMHFNDMAQVRHVDAKMLTNTRAWLMKQRDGKGGFERKRRALHTWIEDRDTSNAYITWALLESGERDLSREVSAVREAAQKSANPYVWALAANALSLAGDGSAAKGLMDRVASKQGANGAVEGATQSIVGSSGEALTIETTSLAVLAWLRNPAFAGRAEKSVRFLADSCQGGRYGSTQSTVLALRAIVAYDKARARPKRAGVVRLLADGKQVGAPVTFDASTRGEIVLPDASAVLGSGVHKLELRMEGGAEMPYSVSVRYHALTPDSSPQTKVGLELAMNKTRVGEGELAEATATVTNKTDALLPTAIAIVGLPGGLEPRHDQLKELVKKGTVDAYEVIGREVVLYWRGMEPRKSIRVPLSLVAAVPGTYTGPASRAYLYYGDEHKAWVPGLAVTVVPKR